jgi:hypothetical protein
VDKNTFNTVKSKEWLDQNANDICQMIVNNRSKFNDLTKTKLTYKPQREESAFDNLGPFYRGVSKNGLFGW